MARRSRTNCARLRWAITRYSGSEAGTDVLGKAGLEPAHCRRVAKANAEPIRSANAGDEQQFPMSTSLHWYDMSITSPR